MVAAAHIAHAANLKGKVIDFIIQCHHYIVHFYTIYTGLIQPTNTLNRKIVWFYEKIEVRLQCNIACISFHLP